MKKSILLLSVGLILASCSSNTEKRPDPIQKVRSYYADFTQGLEDLPKSHNIESCESNKLKITEGWVNLIESEMSMQNSIAYGSNDIGRTWKNMAKDNLDIITPLALNSKLDFADRASILGCKSIAEKHYKDIFKVYVGSSYAAYRERAGIGLNELNAEK